MKSQAISNIDQKFEQTWALLAQETKKNKLGESDSDLSLKKLMGCLKWCTAYSVIQTTCTEIISPYHKDASVIIKWFWVAYNEQHNFSEIPPAPKDFFEWYCDSYTIAEERKIYKKKTRNKTVS